jgi:hypothetical protein
VTDPNDIKVNPEGQITMSNGKSIQTINVLPFTPGVALSSAVSGLINVSWDDTQQDTKGNEVQPERSKLLPRCVPNNKFVLQRAHVRSSERQRCSSFCKEGFVEAG